jgi:general secretion pathway protein D
MKQIKPRAILCLILSSLLVQAQAPRAKAQLGEEGDAGNLFDNEIDEPVGTFNQAPPPPPPPPPTDFGASPPPAGFPNDSSPPASAFGGPKSGPPAKSSSMGGASVASKPKNPKPNLADAGIEDMNNKNFGDLIESFDYPNAEITDIVQAISQLTGKNFIIDPSVRGKISIVAPTQITVAEAYKAFLTALAVNSFTVVPSGKFLKIKSARKAQRDSIETYSGDYYPNADIMITRIIHLKHISAEEVNKRLRILPSADGEMTPYEPTNSIIISDYGANIERIMKIINELDKPGFEEQLSVMPIRYAKAKDLADLINQIITKNPTKGGGAANSFGGAPGFGGGVPSFRAHGANGSGTPEELSLVAPDERTNAMIVVGNKAGIEKVRDLVRKLDYKLDPSESGGVNVYYVKYGEAEKISATINQLQTGATGGGAPQGGGGFGGGFQGGFGQPAKAPGQQSIFGGDVKTTFDKNTNSLVITASKQDYETVLNLLSKLDIPKDQVFIEAIIMDMNSKRTKNWNPTIYYLDPSSAGVGRVGFTGGSPGELSNLLNPAGDSGAILGFGGGSKVELNLGSTKIVVPSLLSFIKIFQQNIESNILSTPQILALDNETASIEVGDNITIAPDSTSTAAGVQQTTHFEKASIKLEVTPFIRPDSNVVRLKVEQSVKQPTRVQAVGETLQKSTTVISDRTIKTNLVIASGDTAVLGGLVRDQEELTETKIPVLGDIPILGWLFKAKNVQTNKVNLTVFLTPKIIRSGVNDSHEVLNRVTNNRIDWLKKNYDGRDPYGKTMDSLPRAAQAESENMDSAGGELLGAPPADIDERQPQSVKSNSRKKSGSTLGSKKRR